MVSTSKRVDVGIKDIPLTFLAKTGKLNRNLAERGKEKCGHIL